MLFANFSSYIILIDLHNLVSVGGISKAASNGPVESLVLTSVYNANNLLIILLKGIF